MPRLPAPTALRAAVPSLPVLRGVLLIGLVLLGLSDAPSTTQAHASASELEAVRDEVAALGGPLYVDGLEPIAGSRGIFTKQGAATRIEIFECSKDELCARIVWLRRMQEDDGSERKDLKNPDPDLRARPLIGMQVLWDLELKNRKKGIWKGGQIYNPDDGNSYRASVEFDGPDKADLRACVLILCEDQQWFRVGGPVGETAPETAGATPDASATPEVEPRAGEGSRD